MTLDQLVRVSAERLSDAGVSFGHGTLNAHDEAAWLVLWRLGLPLDTDLTTAPTIKQAMLRDLGSRDFAFIVDQSVAAGEMAKTAQNADRALIAAFMRGLNATRPLKLDHPGLGTTATRSAARTSINSTYILCWSI